LIISIQFPAAIWRDFYTLDFYSFVITRSEAEWQSTHNEERFGENRLAETQLIWRKFLLDTTTDCPLHPSDISHIFRKENGEGRVGAASHTTIGKIIKFSTDDNKNQKNNATQFI